MGNTIWICQVCDSSNNLHNEICQKCYNGKIVEDKDVIAAKSQDLRVERSDLLHIKLNKRATQNVSKLRRNLQQNNKQQKLTNFIDKEFPPSKSSLFMDGNTLRRNNLIHSSGFKQVRKWLRPNQIKVGKESSFPVTLFNDPSPKDVIQGELGTCWFLSALTLLTEKPFLLFNCVITKSYNTDGLHQVRLCKRGKWTIVNIDDYLPCDKNNQLVFSFGRKRQFWVPFMEKALAKMYGSYEAISKGACAEGLQTLTGEPCEVLYLQIDPLHVNFHSFHLNSFQIWKKIMDSKNLGYLMTTLCYNELIQDEIFDKLGLLNRHIYSILDAKEIELGNNMNFKLMQLRNPWGHKEWQGEWSNSWNKWPVAIQSQLGVNNQKNDGCFWISFQDVLKYFYDITICKVRADWSESRQSSLFYDYSKRAEVFILNVTKPGVHEFELELYACGTVNEPFDRNADPDCDLCLILCRINQENGKPLFSCVAYEHCVEYYITLSANLTPGNYMVFATSIKAINLSMNPGTINTSNETNYFKYNIVFHCQSTFSLSKTSLSAEMISDLFYSIALKRNKIKLDLNGNLRTSYIKGACAHGIFAENLSSSYLIRVQLDLSMSKNLESTRFSTVTHDLLYPGSRQLIAFLTPSNYRTGYLISYKLDHKIFPAYNSTLINFPKIPQMYAGLHAVKSL